MALLRKCTAEFIGTFAIVFGGCGAILADQWTAGAVTHVGIAITFGLIVMAMIFATGHLSGAHLNPAVTLAFTFTRHFPRNEVLAYWLAQISGALSASYLHKLLLSGMFLEQGFEQIAFGVTVPFDGLWLTAFIWEFILTFFLMFVIMAVATDTRAVGNGAGLAIGGTVLLDALFGGPFSGASMNPARSLGPALISGNLSFISAYFLGPCCGAVFAAYAYQFARCEAPEKQYVRGCC